MNSKKIEFYLTLLVFVIMFTSCGNKTNSSDGLVDSDTIAFIEEPPTYHDEGYTSLGYIPCYYFDEDEEEYVTLEEKATLYVKVVNNREYYYISIDEDEDNNKYPIEKCSVNVNSHDCNGKVEIKDDNDDESLTLYMHIQAWGDTESSKVVESKDETKNTTTIEVNHHRDLQPVQEWIPCGACQGSGQCATCNGTGRNLYSSDPYAICISCSGMQKCRHCAGHGGQYQTFYR